MFRKLIAQGIGLPLQDAVTHTKILSTKRLLNESQYWDETKMYEYRLNKLIKLINYSYENIPYYNKLFKKYDIKPNSIKYLEDINKIPVLTKSILRTEYSNLISKKINMRFVKKGKTGGTTGSPVPIYKDHIDRSFVWASYYYRWYGWMGLDVGDKVASLWGAKKVLKKSILSNVKDELIAFLQANLVINSFDMNNDSTFAIYNRILKFDPKLLKGYVSSLVNLAGFLNENSINSELNLKALSSTTETLLPYYRKLLEQTFKTKIFDQYGCGEVNAISYECAKHNGMHINTEHVILEVFDNNDLNIIGESGRIIVTNLDNYVMPFIRYENGDIGTLSLDKCTCGVNQPMIHSIEGRKAHTITLANGTKVHGVFFTDILSEVGIFANKVSRFQIYQEKRGNIIFKIETSNLSTKEVNTIYTQTSRFFNNVDIQILDKIQNEKNGKFLYIKTSI